MKLKRTIGGWVMLVNSAKCASAVIAFVVWLASPVAGEEEGYAKHIVPFFKQHCAFKPWPTLLLDGKAMGLKPGNHVKYEQDQLITNLHLTILQSRGLEIDRFSDSTGTLHGIV